MNSIQVVCLWAQLAAILQLTIIITSDVRRSRGEVRLFLPILRRDVEQQQQQTARIPVPYLSVLHVDLSSSYVARVAPVPVLLVATCINRISGPCGTPRQNQVSLSTEKIASVAIVAR